LHLEVDEYDGDLGAGDEEDGEDDKCEAEDVVVLVHPHGGEDEEELHETRTKGQDASHHDLGRGKQKNH
jgi:hypothetical protein